MLHSIFSSSNGMSPVVEQDFIWVGEYMDGTHLAEFDFKTKKENSFYQLKTKNLIRFGLIGHGMRLFFEYDGIFNLNGAVYELIYRTKNKDYYLTGHSGKYHDVITYKDAESSLRLDGRTTKPLINQYNFGYKAQIKVDDITFSLKTLVKIPFNQPVYMNIWLVADKKLNGKLIIRRNGRDVAEFAAPLKKGVGGEVNWVVR